MQNSKNPRTDAEIDDLVNGLNHIAEDQLDRSCRATILDTIEFIKELKLERDQLRKELAESKSWVKASMESAAIASATNEHGPDGQSRIRCPASACSVTPNMAW